MVDSSLDNPFEFTRPIADPQRLMTRAETVRSIHALLRNNQYVSVLAPRQTGKTTFLHELRRAVGDACIYVDFEGTGYADLNELTNDFAQRIGVPGGKGAGRGGAGTLMRFLRGLQGARRRVFLIDEIHSLKNLALEFLQNVRAYYHEQANAEGESVHAFVIAGSIDLADLTLEENSEVSPFNFAREMYLGDFGFDDVRDFIRSRAGEAFSEESIRRIFEFTNGHPYLVQFLCNHLYNLPAGETERQLDDLPKLVEESGAEGLVNIQSMVQHLLETPEEPEGIVMLLEDILAGEPLPFAESHRSIRTLYLKHGCIRREQGDCAIRNPIYELVLKRYFDIRRAAQGGAARRRSGGALGAGEAAGSVEETAEGQSLFLETFARVEKKLESFARVEKKLDALFPHTWLKNYRGFLCARMARGADGAVSLEGAGNTFPLEPGQQFMLSAWLQPQPEFPEGILRARVEITDGDDIDADGEPVSQIVFEVAVDGDGVEVEGRSLRGKVPVDRRSEDFTFVATAPAEPGSYPVWVHVLQGNRLLQVLDFVIIVSQDS